MNSEKRIEFSRIPQPPQDKMGFIDDLKKPLTDFFTPGSGLPPGATKDCMKDGVEIRVSFPEAELPETAFESLRNVLASKGIPEKKGAYPMEFRLDQALSREEYAVAADARKTVVRAADADGFRRAVYFLEDRIREVEGPAVMEGNWKRRPFVKHRISRCFFGPTYRPPFFIDELTNDVDYYPDTYLNKLAHEGINGLWLSMYFRDLPSSIFPGRGKDAQKRFAKLRQTVERCGRFGIRIYIYFCEPKIFGSTYYSVPVAEAADHKELLGGEENGFFSFCTSSETGKKYLAESVETLFTAVPELGGMINIMFGEDNGACVNWMMYDHAPRKRCPLCSRRQPSEIFGESARIMTDAMHRASPGAEFIGWFYAPGQRDGSAFMHRLEKVADHWPEESGLMFNLESGGVEVQLGKGRNVFDYSLAYIGPSELFRSMASRTKKMAAKIQVGCSHENASVPFIPVPGNLYEKYKAMRELGVYAAMQCWYFGNYPGLMNKAAGELSFEPFPGSEEEFLARLARPDWRKDTPTVVRAWMLFSRAYRKFPANIAFEWWGPLHQSIAWPLHLFPVEEPISPSWVLKHFPEVSGDRIGECLGFQHTLEEALVLCHEMFETWQEGFWLLQSVQPQDPARKADIDLAEAILLQMHSTFNVLQFYSVREEMFRDHADRLPLLRKIVESEISNTLRMKELCERDSRLGYHSEAEGYLFFPEKLEARAELLRLLLEEDFPRFRPDDPAIDEYTGKKPAGLIAVSTRKGKALQPNPIPGKNASWTSYHDEETLYFEVEGLSGEDFRLEIEPCRLWQAFRIDFLKNGEDIVYEFIFRVPPQVSFRHEENRITVGIPLSIFDGYRHEGFPMRVNIQGKDFSWAGGKPWESRLLQRDFNPNNTGWLILQ